MTDTEVTVAYVNAPRGRAKSGSIKDTDGAYYGIKWPDWEHEFKPGCTYKIRYEQNGQYRNITQYRMTGGAPTAPGPAAGDPQLAERIFVCGAVNATMSNPNVQPNSPEWNTAGCINLVNHWRNVWAATFGGKTTLTPKDDMNDEIPF